MKFLKTIITAFFLLLMMNCSPYRTAIITDGNDASNRSLADYQSVKKSNLDESVFLVNGKKVTLKKLQKYDDLTSVNVITDEAEIERLGYDAADVKSIVVCEREK